MTKTHRFDRLAGLCKTGLLAFAGAAALCAGFSTSALAQRSTPVSVQNDVNVTSTVRRIPVYCRELILSPEDEEVASCFRADTRQQVTPVPQGFNLAITDVLTNRNSLTDDGSFFVAIGRDTPAVFPGEPRFDFSGDQTMSPSLHFNSPALVFLPGEDIKLLHGEFANQGGTTVDVFLSGYIVAQEDLGRE